MYSVVLRLFIYYYALSCECVSQTHFIRIYVSSAHILWVRRRAKSFVMCPADRFGGETWFPECNVFRRRCYYHTLHYLHSVYYTFLLSFRIGGIHYIPIYILYRYDFMLVYTTGILYDNIQICIQYRSHHNKLLMLIIYINVRTHHNIHSPNPCIYCR